MSRRKKSRPGVVYQFVDEAGDLTLFDRQGRIIVGNEGVSKYFIMAVAAIPDPADLEQKLGALRAMLLADPFLSGAPSMQPGRRKTALTFHAKDDLPEVRHEVFKLLLASEVKILAAVRRKDVLAAEAARTYREFGTRFVENDVYDDLLKRLLRDRLHLGESNELVIAKRGTKNRTAAITAAIARARENFAWKWGDRPFPPTRMTVASPSESAGLQVVDYFLWALQRLYERREARYFTPLSSMYRIVMDIDDKRHTNYGEWYSDSNPLTLAKIKPEAG